MLLALDAKKKIFSGTNSHVYVIQWIHDYLKTIRNHLPSELASPYLGNNQNLINWLNPERWFEKLWPLLISAENSVNLLSETDFFTSSSVRKRRGEEIEADVRRAIAERKRACMWKRSLLGKQYIQSDVLASQLPQPTCSWKWVGWQNPFRQSNLTLAASSAYNSCRTSKNEYS